MTKQSYRDLHVWRESVALVPEVYACLIAFPAHERFALADQMRRAAVSIAANIAEGQALFYPKGFLHHLCIARGSLAELQTLLIVAEQLGYVPPERFSRLDEAIESVAKPLHGLIAKVRERIGDTGPRQSSQSGRAGFR